MSTKVIADRYELHDLVGAGGMSSVYKAHDTLLERNVALKILHEHFSTDEEYAERFRHEARAVAQLSHPSIVTVIDRGEAEGRHFIVFELIEGQSLKELVDRDGPLPVPRALELALEIAGALAYAHRNGIVHRDVKPQNVLLNGDGRAKVTDFGIARSLDVEGVTRTGTVLGTSNYIAPEQASGDAVSPQTDVYSLGVVLFELLTGKVPFEGDNFVQIAMQHINAMPPNAAALRPDVPPRVATAVDRALEKEPEARFDSMDEFAAELLACLADLVGEEEAEGQATMIVPAAAVSRARKPSRPRWPFAAAAAALLAAGGIAAGVLALTGGDGESPAEKAAAKPLPLRGVASYDPPPGDGREHDEVAGNATDGDESTYWTTEQYSSDLPKPGVGLVMDGRRAGVFSQVRVLTDTPGFRARVLAGNSRSGPFRIVSGTRPATGNSVYAIKGDRPARYWVIWITNLGGYDSVHLNEVRGN